MQRRGKAVRRLISVRLWFQRFSFLLLVAVALGSIIVSRSNAPWISQFRAGFMDTTAPLLETLAIPVRAVSSWFSSFDDMKSLRADNARLTRENRQLRFALTEAQRYEAENRRLRELVRARPPVQGRHIGARVMAGGGGAYSRTFILAAGKEQGVRDGLAVLASDGLVGRIVNVGEHTSRALLITDLNSRLPVMLVATGERAVLAGQNGRLGRLMYLPLRHQVKVGARVVTSGHGAVMPPGLPVGEVVAVRGNRVMVRPYASLNRVTFVRILDHAAQGLLTPQKISGAQKGGADKRAERGGASKKSAPAGRSPEGRPQVFPGRPSP